MGSKKTGSKGEKTASDAGAAAAAAATPRSTPAPEEVPLGGRRTLRSSGKKPLTAEEADRYEELARKRRPSRSRSCEPNPIVISDDDEETSQPECKPGFPDPSTIGRGCKPPTNRDGPELIFKAIAQVEKDQASVVPDSDSAEGLIQRLENTLKQMISILQVGWGTYSEFHPYLVSCLGEIRRVGGDLLANRCDQKLVYWEQLAMRTEKLASGELENEVWRIIGEERVKIIREREGRAQRILEQEAAIADLHGRQHRLQQEIDACHSAAAPSGVRPAPVVSKLDALRRESVGIDIKLAKAKRALRDLLREEEAAIAALTDDRLYEAAKAKVQEDRAQELVALKAELDSFTVLDCLD